MEPRLKVTYLPTAELVPYAHNAKEHPAWQVEQIAESIKQFGNCDPIAIWHNADGEAEIVEGHGRLMALQMLGIDKAPTISLDHLDDDARRAYTHVHNRLNMNTGFEGTILQSDLDSLTGFDWEALGFNMDADWFDSRERWDMGRTGDEEYDAFLDKFEPKRTTDDCYTPDNIYEAVASWVSGEYGIKREDMVRPFYPGGDYRREEYPEGCCVVDNPPFSILAEIIRFYDTEGIRFFLFAPALTLFSSSSSCVTCITLGVSVTYENGANVSTSFVTNLDEVRIRTAPDLYEVVEAANDVNLEAMHADLPKYSYPDEVMTASRGGVPEQVRPGCPDRFRRVPAHLGARCPEGAGQGHIRVRLPSIRESGSRESGSRESGSRESGSDALAVIGAGMGHSPQPGRWRA